MLNNNRKLYGKALLRNPDKFGPKTESRAATEILEVNQDKNFVKRLYAKKLKSIQVPGEPGRSSHLMGSGGGRVLPTVVEPSSNKPLEHLNWKDAVKYAKINKEFIDFGGTPLDDSRAQWFAENGYKTAEGINKDIKPPIKPKIVPKEKTFLEKTADVALDVNDAIRSVNDNKYVQAAKMLDPTGISNYPDVAYAINDAIVDPSKENLLNVGGNILGALPMLGKGRVAINLVRGARAGRVESKALKLNKVIKAIEGKVDEVRNIASVAEKPVELLAKQGSTSNKILKPIAKGAEKVVNTAEYLSNKLKLADKRYASKSADINSVAVKNIGADLLDITKTARDVSNIKDNFQEPDTDLRNFDLSKEERIKANQKLDSIPKLAYGGNINNNDMKLAKRLPLRKRYLGAGVIKDEDIYNNTTGVDLPEDTSPTTGGMNKALAAGKLIPGLNQGIAGEALSMAATGASLGGPIGAGIGAGVGIIGGVINAEQAKEEERRARRQQYLNKQTADTQLLEESRYAKTPDVHLYGCGGHMRAGKKMAIGGELNEIADGVQEVDGNTHGENTIDGQYGVTLQHPQTGEPVAEVEDKEVIVDNKKVFSDRLTDEKGVTFANRMKQIATKSHKIEEKLEQTGDTRRRNGLERQLAGMKMAEESLFNKQEAMKQTEGNAVLDKLPVMAYGGPIDPRKRNIYAEPQMEDNVYGNINSRVNSRLPVRNQQGFAQELDPNYTPDYPTNDPAVLERSGLNNWVNTNREPLTGTSELTPRGMMPYSTPLPTGSTIRQDRQADRTLPEPKPTDESFMKQLAPRLGDNLVNAVLTGLTPQVARPTLMTTPRMETKVNIGSQLAAINRSRGAMQDKILGNTSNSNTARAEMTSSNLRHLESKLGVIDNKETREQDLRNANLAQQYATTNANAKITDAYNEANVQRRHDIQSRISGNVGDLSKDIANTQTRKDLMDKQDQEIIITALGDRTGETMKVIEDMPFGRKAAILAAIKAAKARRAKETVILPGQEKK